MSLAGEGGAIDGEVRPMVKMKGMDIPIGRRGRKAMNG
jgi:hypothetical protein